MRRSAWIFLAAIFLPSLGLAWLAIHSVRDQQVVLEHQEAIICQNITDALSKSIQAQMDQARGDFVKTTQQLLGESASPQVAARDFNRKLREAWPMAEIGFAVDLDGEIYSPRPNEGSSARTFLDENDRFLSNRENAEVYSNSFGLNANNPVAINGTGAVSGGNLAMTGQMGQFNLVARAAQNQAAPSYNVPVAQLHAEVGDVAATDALKEKAQAQDLSTVAATTGQAYRPQGGADLDKAQSGLAGHAASAPKEDQDRKAQVNSSIAVAQAPSPPADTGAALKTSAPSNVTEAPLPGAVPTAAASPAGPAKGLEQAKDEEVTMVAPPAAAPTSTSPEAAGSSQLRDTKTAETTRARAATAAAPASAPVSFEHQVDEEKKRNEANADTTAQTTPSVSAPSSTMDDLQSASAKIAPVAAPVLAPTDSSVAQNTQDGIQSSSSLLNNSLQQVLKIPRKVIPQQMSANEAAPLSNSVPEDSDFQRVIGSDASGELARFLENKLRLIIWSRPTNDSSIIFGAQLDQEKLVETLKASFQVPELAQASFSRSTDANYCVAILDDTGRPVALSRPGYTGDWKHPFVATEIGEALPHWEAALYLVDPQQISRAARTLQFTLGLIVLLLVAAIVSGGSLIAADVRRQVRLAQQKTDFVSNVSHELKTPLTSIRMFADLLAEKRVPDEERQATYLRIISAESARLTRLINNVLDFARLERGAPPGEHHACDLVDAVRDVVETCQPHLETAGIAFRSEIEAESLPIIGDRDALAQIILNLVSNAEKYGGNDILVRVRRQEIPSGALGCVDVLDRGSGIPPKDVKTIFEAFHRLDDSLSSGIPGSGLGLTLARRMARGHGGDVTYSPRAGGGSCFTLSVPLKKMSS